MRTISIHDILDTLRHADPDILAAAVYADQDPRLLTVLADALTTAAQNTATYPHPDVVREADALLFDVLRWPVADALPPGQTLPTARALAVTRGIAEPDAQRLLDRIVATEHIAASRLLASGIDPDFTLEQTLVTACIRALHPRGTIPTRASVRAHAVSVARAAMRPGDGPEPFTPTADGLATRVLSPSAMTRVPAWLDRMDANPPPVGLMDMRIGYLRAAQVAIGTASRHHTRILTAEEHSRARGTSAPQPGTGLDCLNTSPRLAG